MHSTAGSEPGRTSGCASEEGTAAVPVALFPGLCMPCNHLQIQAGCLMTVHMAGGDQLDGTHSRDSRG